MVNEISQQTLSTMSSQPKRESGGTSPVQALRSLDPSGAVSAVKTPAAPEAERQEPSDTEQRQLEEVVDDLNGFAQSVQRQLQFSIDRDNGKMIVKVVDVETDSVIREIPSEEVREMQKKLQEVNDMLFHKGDSPSVLFQGEA